MMICLIEDLAKMLALKEIVLKALQKIVLMISLLVLVSKCDNKCPVYTKKQKNNR